MAPMNLNEWLSQFCEWHDSFKRGALAEDSREAYMRARHELCGALLMAQRLAIEPGAAARGALRVARAYQIEFGLATGSVTAITSDISTSGLSALVAESPPTGTVLWLRLKIGGGAVIVGRCQVVKIIPKQGSNLMCVAFEGLPTDAREKIETVVCDVVVTELRAATRHWHQAAGHQATG
jgi:ribosomal protein L30E